MEYRAFAYELTKVAAPRSAQGLYAQEKADKEFKTLMESSQPGAVPKAFAKGFATGAALPLLISANIHFANKANIERARSSVRQDNVAKALKSMGVKQPRDIAAAFDNMAIKPDGTPRNVLSDRLNSARFTMDSEIMQGRLQNADIPDHVRKAAKNRTSAFRGYRDDLRLVGELQPNSPMSDPANVRRAAVNKAYPSKMNIITPREVLELERIGKSLPGKSKSVGRVYTRQFMNVMKRGLHGPAIIGALAGGIATHSALKRRKKYVSLRAKANRMNAGYKASRSRS